MDERLASDLGVEMAVRRRGIEGARFSGGRRGRSDGWGERAAHSERSVVLRARFHVADSARVDALQLLEAGTTGFEEEITDPSFSV